MAESIRILHLEDDLSIVKLIRRLLEAEGYVAEVVNVQARAEYLSALENGEYDLILADYSLPDFDGLIALDLLRQKNKTLPFILFPGSIGEQKAIACLRRGATDYVLKENITALMPAINRALQEAESERKRIAAEEALRNNEILYRTTLQNMPIGALNVDLSGVVKIANQSFMTFMDIDKKQQIENTQIVSFPPFIKSGIASYCKDLFEKKNSFDFESPAIYTLKGREVYLRCRGVPNRNITGEIASFSIIIGDITKRKKETQLREVIYNISSDTLKLTDEKAFYRMLQKELGRLIDTSNFIIALYNKHDDTFNIPFINDAQDNFETVPAAHTLSGQVVKLKKSILLREEEMPAFFKKYRIRWVGTPAKCWLGVPLIAEGQSIGLIIIQSYTDVNAYNNDDLHLLEFVAGQVGLSIKRKQDEIQIKRLWRSVEQSPSSIVLTDIHGTIEYVNPQFERITGYSLQEAIGQNPRILKSGEMSQEEYEKLWETITSGKIWRGRFHNRRKDGSLFWEDASIGPVTDETGKIINFMAIKENVTRLKEAEEALALIFRQNEQLLQAITSALIVLDEKETVIRWNPAAQKAFGIEDKAAIGKKLLELGIQWDWVEISQAIGKCRTDGQTVELDDVKCTDAQGKEHFLNIDITNFGRKGADDSGFLILAEDITDWKIMQSQLNQAQKLESIGQLASGIAHEINTPIQYIGDNVRFLNETFNDVKDLLEFFIRPQAETSLQETFRHLSRKAREADLEFLLQDIPEAFQQTAEGVSRVTKIVKAMKEFTHPHQEEKTPVDVNKALKNTILISKNEWKYVAEVKTDLQKDLPIITGFLGELNQVFLNLLVNAAHAIDEALNKNSTKKGTITIRSQVHGRFVRIEIEDTGTGIKSENREKVFNPFFTTKEVGKGTGQGLTLTHAIITQKHNGKIWFETQEGKGTTFIVELPID